jgi:isoquinoline 1-oxidoreductase beta subunit
MTQHARMSRREFLGSTASLTLALTIAPEPLIGLEEARADAPLSPNAWLTITPDGTITIVSPAAEMGQGTFTTVPAIIAEELDADWSKVKPIFPPAWDEKKYGNPEYGMAFQTSASASVRGYFKPARLAGAQARRVLLDAVAAKWNVPVAELSTEPGTVVHKASGRRVGYGEIASFAKAPAELPKVEEKDLKDPTKFRLIGQHVPRVEVPLKVTGAAKYGMDVQVPGMVYAAVLQSPYPGGSPQTVDDTAARKVPGITDIVKLPEGVAVIGDTVEGTQAAKNLLKVTWSGDAVGAHLDSERALEEFAAIGRDKSREGLAYTTEGDAKSAMAAAAKVYRGEYRTRYVYHAQMEPMNATASVSADGKSAEVWTGTQGASGLLNAVAKLLETDRSNITLNQHFLGGGYGRRGQHETVLDAVRLAKAVRKPVKLIWSREDDVAFGKFRPMTAHYIEAGLDAKGKVVAWHHRVVAESVVAYTSGDPTPRQDRIVMKGSPIPQ